MPYYRAVGEMPAKRHLQFRREDGRLYTEELMGVEGFSSDSSLLYHRHAPTTLLEAELVADAPYPPSKPNAPLLPRHFRTQELGLQGAGGNLVEDRVLLASNTDVRISYAVADSGSPMYRNAIGDEMLYIQSGTAVLESVFGTLAVGPGDYVNVPTSTTHRWTVTGAEPVRALVIEASGHIRPPKHFLSQYGQFLERAPFSERDLRGPEGPLLAEQDEETWVIVRHHRGITRYLYAHHPFDVVGWDGCLYPFAFSIHDYEPTVKRTHLPPPTHQTFEGPNFVICSFCPRPFDFDPDAVPIPYTHANVDSDELILWLNTDPMSKKYGGIEPGSMTLHPGGWIHGPQPGRTEASLGKPGTDELFVMVDTFRPLDIAVGAEGIEDDEYAWTWAKGERAFLAGE